MKQKLVFPAVLAMLVGCSSPHGQREIHDEQTAKEASVVLKSAARSAALVALEKHPEKASDAIARAHSIVQELLTQQDKTPEALSTRFQPLVKEIDEVEIQIAVNTALDLYQVFYGRYIPNVGENETASLFLEALRDGAQEALKLQE